MSDTVIEPVKFESKFGIKYLLQWSPKQNLWKIFMFPEDDIICIARFKQQSKALEFCELLKESE